MHRPRRMVKLVVDIRQDIQDFVMTKVDKEDERTWYWIGGYHEEEDEEWKWTDGSSWTLESWATQPVQQPNDYNDNRVCIQIFGGDRAENGWNGKLCTKGFGFICSVMLCPGNEITQSPVIYEHNIRFFWRGVKQASS